MTFGANVRHKTIGEVTWDGTMNVTIDGTKYQKSASLGRYSSGVNMFLFAGNSSGNPGWKCKAKLYGCRIWQDGSLVRDFRPCVDASGKAALYDVVNCRFHYPSGGDLAASATEVPATAVWKGGAVGSASDLSVAANWECRNPLGEVIADGVPSAATTVLIDNAADPLLSIAPGTTIPEWGDVKLAASMALADVADWRALGRLTLGNGISLDLSGHSLTTACFTAEGSASVVNGGASQATFAIAGAGMSSLGGVTLGDKVKVAHSGDETLGGGTASETYFGSSNNSVEIEMGNGTFVLEKVFRLGWNAPGTFTICDGAKVYVYDGSVGHGNGGVGTLVMNGGELSVKNNLWFGAFDTSVGSFVQNGGTAVIDLSLRLAGANAASTMARGSFVQTGGTLQTGQIFHGTGVATVVLDGGTLKPNKEIAEFFYKLDDVTLGANGVTIDTAYNIGSLDTTITVQNGGKIVKVGAGVFDLSGLTVQMGEGVTSSFDFAVAEAGAGGFTGVPTVPKSWKAKLSEDGMTCRMVKSGFVIIVK